MSDGIGGPVVMKSRAKVLSALAKAQGEMKAPPKDKDNPYFGSKYADLANIVEAIRAPFAKHGLGFYQDVESDESSVTCTTTVFHESGEELVGKPLKLPVGMRTSKDGSKSLPPNAQTFGSATTYARRYSLQTLVGVAAEADDDGNGAGEHAAPAPIPAYTPRETTPAPKPEPKQRKLEIRDDGPASPEPPPQPAVDYSPSRERPQAITFRFGKSKGSTSHDVKDKDLAWYLKCAKESLADPDKQRFRTDNEREVQALQAEVFWRSSGGVPTAADEDAPF